MNEAKMRITVPNTNIVISLNHEERFDRLTRLAQRIFNTPIAIISLIDNESMRFKSCQGLDVSEIPSKQSFCSEAMKSEKTFYIPDTLEDPRFCGNPLVIGSPRIRFYAGTPITLAGQKIGTLCVIDIKPRIISDNDLTILYELGICIQAEFEQLQKIQLIQQFDNQQKYLAAILNTVVNGIVTIDEQGKIQTANRAALEIFGYTMQELQHNNVNILMPEPFRSEHNGYLHNYLSSHKAKVIGLGREVKGMRKNGDLFPMYLAVGEMELDNKKHFVGIVADITEHRKTQQHLEQFKYILDHTIDCIFMCRTDNFRFVYVNEGAKQQVGYSEAELLTMTAVDIKPNMSKSSYAELVAELLNGSKISHTFETVHRHKQGHDVPVEVTLQVVKQLDNDGLQLLVAVVRDTSERKVIERMKSQFVSTVSHELRTPLTSIRGALGLALGGALGEIPEKARTMLSIANRNSERLTLLINDLLDLEKIESERMSINFKLIDLVEIVYQTLETNQSYADNYQVTLKLTELPETAWVNADEHRLLQVFANLLSNAIKFSPVGGVVELSVIPHTDYYEVRITDHGNGIPEAFRERIFGRFAQADSADNRQKDGSGLGLSISKAIVERHKGKIGFDSQEGVGSTFFFSIPRSKTAPTQEEMMQHPACILLSHNNDKATLKQLALLLKLEGLRCDIANTAAEAKLLLEKRKYILIMIDLSLSDQDALDLTKDFHSLPNTSNIPVIIICCCGKEHAINTQTIGISVADWIQKPITHQRLQQVLQSVICGSRLAKVLHIEDDLDIIQVIQTMLKEKGVDYSFATTLADARIFLANQTFDLVILDVGLPDGSGLELLDELKDRCPVVLFSGDEMIDSLSQQVSAALIKSKTNNDQLLSTIRRVLNNTIQSKL